MLLSRTERALLAVLGFLSVAGGVLVLVTRSIGEALQLTLGIPLVTVGAVLAAVATRPTSGWLTALGDDSPSLAARPSGRRRVAAEWRYLLPLVLWGVIGAAFVLRDGGMFVPIRIMLTATTLVIAGFALWYAVGRPGPPGGAGLR